MSTLASPGGRLGRAARVTSALVVAGLCLTGCAQTPKPPVLSHREVLYYNAADSIVWCLLHRQIIPLRDVRGQPWFKNGKMQNDGSLAVWLSDNAPKTYGGQTLLDWIVQARTQWPTSLCGPEPTTFPSAPVYPPASPSP